MYYSIHLDNHIMFQYKVEKSNSKYDGLQLPGL